MSRSSAYLLFRLAGARRHRQGVEAFTLVELMIAVAASTIVVGGLAALLVASVRASRQAEQAQTLKDEWNLAATFIQREIGNAVTLTTAVGAYECPGGAPSNPLVLNGPSDGAAPAWRVIYGVRPLSNAEWIGPNVIVRCGRPYLENLPTPPTDPFSPQLDPLFGELDPSTGPSESVLLDRLPALASFAPVLATSDGTSLARDVNVTLALQSLFGAEYQNQFRARVGVNPAYARLAFDEATGVTCAANAVCQETLRPKTCQAGSSNCFTVFESRASGTGGRIQPPAPEDDQRRIELAVYFPGPRGSYTIQRAANDTRTCILTSCWVGAGASGTSILPPPTKPFASIVLSFTDQQIRV